jgi:SAM-dependent methyltransferase
LERIGIAERYKPEWLTKGYLALRRAADSAVDRVLNIDTTHNVDLERFGLNAPDRVGYVASGWLDLYRMLRPEDVTSDSVFLDLGSGKGRIVILAARYPFRKIIGVELSEDLTAIARRNVANCRARLRCRDIELITCDVLNYRIPDDVSVVYMYNPFHGPIFDAAIASLIASVDRRPRTVRLIYGTASCEDRLLSTGRFSLERMSLGVRPSRAWREKIALRLYTLRPLQR